MFKMERYLLSETDLGRWVKFIWHFKGESVDVRHRLLPMDSIDIIVNLEADMVYETEAEKIVAPRMHVNGLRDRHSFMYQKGNVDVWGISFHAYGLYPFVGKSLSRSMNHIIDLRTLSPVLTDKLEMALSEEMEQRKIQRMVQALSSEFKMTKRSADRETLIKAFMADEDTPIPDFCMEQGITQKTFERFIADMTGFSPVGLRNLKRYSAASKQLLAESSMSITDIVYDNRYTDQAYFTKAIKKYSGVSPKVFRNESGTVVENMVIENKPTDDLSN